MQVVTVKLMTGEEIIARQISNDEKGLVLSTARLMAPTQHQGAIALALMPWAFGCNQDGNLPPIKDSAVVFVNSNVPKDLEDRYVQETSSIQLVN